MSGGPRIRVSAQAYCDKCGGWEFSIYILECGCPQARCSKCEEIWEAPTRAKGQNVSGDETVGSDGHESPDVVSEAAC